MHSPSREGRNGGGDSGGGGSEINRDFVIVPIPRREDRFECLAPSKL